MYRFGRRRRPSRFARRVGTIARRATGQILAKRILLEGVTVPVITSAAYDTEVEIPLVEALETMDEEVISNGTTVADVPLYSKLVSLKANLVLQASVLCRVRWMLYKEPDGESLVTDLGTQFVSSDDTPTMREIRKYTLAKGMIVVAPDRLSSPMRIFVSKQAWKRASPMRENDRITLVISQNTSATLTVSGFGTIYARANG